MTRDGLIAGLVEEMGFTEREAADFLDTMLDELRSTISSGRRARLTEFGSFGLVVTRGVRGMERKKVSFAPAKGLRARVASAFLDASEAAPESSAPPPSQSET